MHATIPKGNMGYDQCTFPDTVAVKHYFCCFSLALANIRPWPLVPFFEISLKNSELKITHYTFRDFRVQFFRQPFLKQLYTFYQSSNRRPLYISRFSFSRFFAVLNTEPLHYAYEVDEGKLKWPFHEKNKTVI